MLACLLIPAFPGGGKPQSEFLDMKCLFLKSYPVHVLRFPGMLEALSCLLHCKHHYYSFSLKMDKSP
jgi:hypothetical protein